MELAVKYTAACFVSCMRWQTASVPSLCPWSSWTELPSWPLTHWSAARPRGGSAWLWQFRLQRPSTGLIRHTSTVTILTLTWCRYFTNTEEIKNKTQSLLKSCNSNDEKLRWLECKNNSDGQSSLILFHPSSHRVVKKLRSVAVLMKNSKVSHQDKSNHQLSNQFLSRLLSDVLQELSMLSMMLLSRAWYDQSQAIKYFNNCILQQQINDSSQCYNITYYGMFSATPLTATVNVMTLINMNLLKQWHKVMKQTRNVDQCPTWWLPCRI